MSNKLPVFKEDTLLPRMPGDEEIEVFLFSLFHVLQKWGSVIVLLIAVMCVIAAKIFKIRKNPKAVRFWKFTSYGMVLVGILFIILPYVVLYFY
ncbi:hypothetical protein V1503_24100 [Bacillus sp. SCS-151]|uniref:hypothetical protein n=1 Tax=Nanhaiella sioensis TaxID=3115293 RepID=UPI00397A6BF7